MKMDRNTIHIPRVSLRGFVSNESGDLPKTIRTLWIAKRGIVILNDLRIQDTTLMGE